MIGLCGLPWELGLVALSTLFMALTSGAKAEPNPDLLRSQPAPFKPPSGNPQITEHPEDSFFAKNEPATLYCKAQGDPPPQITWYRNGKPVETNKENPLSHRMLLDNGQLFLLRVIHSKKEQSDIGQYYCNATNIHGSAISRTADIQIAVLKDDFGQEPMDSTAAVGQTVVLHCQPPRGKPEPKVLWYKDGEPVLMNDRVDVQDSGNLVLTSVVKTDIGRYVCLAINDAGEKRSNPAMLNVLDVPQFRKLPKDLAVEVGKTAEFECEATGDPPIKIHWSKEDGTISYGRARLDQNNLRIEDVEPQDEGVYVCYAENAAGSTQATARLVIFSSPSIMSPPRDQVVARGRTVSLPCGATGNPSPTIFWRKGQENVESGDRFTLLGDGTLRIEAIQETDAGIYECEALNTKGQAKARALVKVIVHDPRPPPVIKLAPQNQTLLVKTSALIHCEADGSPQPTIRWFKDGRPLDQSEPRFRQLQTGSLQISDLELGDKGWYSCKAISETGETARMAYMAVEYDVGQSPDRASPASYLPDPPTKPVVTDVTDTTVHLSWAPGIQVGRSPVHAFSVEYFGFETSQGWVVASTAVSRESYTVEGLQPNTTYLFLVRAVNNDGIGYPSLVSEPVRTLANRDSQMADRDMDRRLKGTVVELTTTKSNSSTISLTWEVLKGSELIDSFDVEYRLITDIQRLQYGSKDVVRVSGGSRNFMLTGLKSYTWYELCVRAVAKQIRTQCSNLIKVQTEETEDKYKLEAPNQVRVQPETETSVSVHWKPPGQTHVPVLGYQVLCVSEDQKQNCSTETDGQTFSVVIKKLQPDQSYKIQVAAQTPGGRGFWSEPITAGKDSASTVKPVTNQETEEMDLFKRPWFIGVLIGVVGVMLWVLLCIFSIWLCKKNKKKKKMKDTRDPRFYTGVPLHKGDDCHRNIVYPPQYGLKDRNINCSSDMDLPPELHILLPPPGNKESEDHNIYKMAGDGSLPEMRTFYQKVDPVAPYATTALIQQQNLLKQRGMDHLFRPINQGYIQHSEGSADSCQKAPLSSDSNNDRSHSTTDHNHSDSMQSPTSDSGSHSTDENGLLIKQKKKNNNNMGRVDSVNKGGKPGTNVNWAELLPPPPEHPPPSECGDPVYHDVRSERGHTQSPMSPVSFSQLSACSCPNPHTQTPISGWNMPVYSDNDCHRCHSEKYYDPMTYCHDAYIKRTHSPRSQTLKHVNSNKSMHQNGCMHSPRGTPSVNYQYSQPHRSTPTNCANQGQVEMWSNNFNRASHSSRSDNESPNIVPCFPGLRLGPKPEKDYRFLQENEWGPDPAPPYHSCVQEADLEEEVPGRERAYPGDYHGNIQEHPGVNYHPRSAMQSSVTMPRNCDSPNSEGADYATESDLEQNDNKNWTTDHNTDVSSMRSSTCSSGDGTFLTEEDFASAVARAAAMSGLTVVGTTVVDNKKKDRKHRRQARPVSPGYSTDSNYGSIDVVRRPFPKSERKRMLQDQGRPRRGDTPDNQQYNPSDSNTAVYDTPYGRTVYSPAAPHVPVRLSSLNPNCPPTAGRHLYDKGHYSGLLSQPISLPMREDVV